MTVEAVMIELASLRTAVDYLMTLEITGAGMVIPHQLLDAPWHTDTATNTPPAAGSIIVSTAGFAWSETVHPGVATQYLRSNAAIPGYSAILAGDLPNLGGMPALTYGVANAAGAAATYVRTDATIDIYDAVAPGTIQCDDAAGAGVAVAAARRDHQHAIVNAVAVNIGNANAEGASTSFSRADHVHDHVAALGVNLHHNEVHVVNSTGPHAEAGLTIGHVLRVSGAAAFSFAALIAADLPAHTHAGAATGGSLVVGTTDTDATVGSVFFAGAAGVIQQDNANLFWVDGTNRLGVGINTPDGTLHVHTASAGAVVGFGPLIVESDTPAAINILTPDDSFGALLFGSPVSAERGGISYNHDDDELSFAVAENTVITMTTTSVNILAGYDLNLAPGQGITHDDGVAAGELLLADGVRYVPSGWFVAGTAAQTYTFGTAAGTITTSAGTLSVSSANAVTGAGVQTHGITTSSNPGANARILASDAAGLLQLEGLGIRAALGANAAGLYVPWIAGDAVTTGVFGSSNAANTMRAVEGFSYSNAGVFGSSNTQQGVYGVSSSGNGVYGTASTGGIAVHGDGTLTGTGGDFQSVTGTAGIFNLTGAGVAIVVIQDNGTPVLTIQDGGQADFAEYIRHLGDTNTYLRFETDRVRCFAGGIQMIDAFETGVDYLNFHAGIVGINETANTFQAIGLTINQAANDNTNESLSIKASDIAHGMTTQTETDTFGTVRKISSGLGGLQLSGYTESTAAIRMWGNGVTDVTTRGNAALGYTIIRASKKTGTTVGATGATANLLVVQNHTTTRFIFQADGTAYADVAWGTFSDRRLKRDIQPTRYGLAEVLALQPVDYILKEQGRAMVGLIAQDVYEVVPEATRKPPNDESYWGMDYNALVPVLVRSDQELHAEIVALKKRIEELENG